MWHLLAQSSDADAAGGLAALAMMPLFCGLGLALYVVMGISLMTIANKLGIENSWMAWIPFANMYLLTQCAGVDWWYLLLCFIPYVGIIPAIYMWWKVCERRGKPGPLALAMLIPCLGLAVPVYVAFAD